MLYLLPKRFRDTVHYIIRYTIHTLRWLSDNGQGIMGIVCRLGTLSPEQAARMWSLDHLK